jgi:hypothetical protein
MKQKEDNEISERLEKYLNLTKKALGKAEKAKIKDKNADAVLDMAQRYYSDSLYFKKKNMLLVALCAVSYAHGWLDCGSKLGLFDVKDSKLFVVK